MNRVIQRAVYPSLDLCPEPKLFFRLNSAADIDINHQRLMLFPTGWVKTSTYFNSLSVGKWKQNTNIDQLSLRIGYQGEIKLTFKLSDIGAGTKILYETFLSNKNGEVVCEVSLPFWPQLQSGMLYFEIYALDRSEVSFFEYITPVPAVRSLKLGIVITHYNRLSSIQAAIHRLKYQLLEVDEFKDKLSLIVVDNSKNLPPVEGIVVIKNANLGGAGGFARGLLYLQSQPEFTHALFMDDDAACEVESIKRTINILESTTNSSLAVAGAMLMEKEVYRQHESGAYFDGRCRSLGKGANLVYEYDLLKNERPKRAEYGAWWFFAFALEGVNYNPFPYFVRGDDISFSYANQFDIFTMNGIASWQPDFANKSTPMTVYLDMRNHLMHVLHGFVKGPAYLTLLKTSLLIYAYQALSYFYDSAQAVNVAIEDVLKGPDFWREDINLAEKRKEINQLLTTESLVPTPKDIYSKGEMAPVERQSTTEVFAYPQRWSRLALYFRYGSLNGHLLPSYFFHPGFAWVKKSSGSRTSSSFRYKEVIFLDQDAEHCLILKHDKKRFFAITFRFIYLLMKLMFRYQKLSKVYRKTYQELTSSSFWQEQFERYD
ncbi:MAG: glycosyltransferase [Neisseriaceae bacterium]